MMEDRIAQTAKPPTIKQLTTSLSQISQQSIKEEPQSYIKQNQWQYINNFYLSQSFRLIMYLNISMLQVLTGKQIVLKPLSETDLRLRGQITMKNTIKNHNIVFKMKSTNPRLFDAQPIKGLIPSSKQLTITITTSQPIMPESAKQVSLKNKFMIQYAAVQRKSLSVDQAIDLLKGPGVQQIKIFINTSSMKNSKSGKYLREASVANSHKYSYHSMVQQAPTRHLNIQPGDQLEKLKTEVEYLQKKRVELIKNVSNEIKKNKGNKMMTILFLVAGLVIGNLGSKMMGLPQTATSTLMSQPEPQQQQGFLSIFNFGQQEEPPKKEEQSWWNIL